MAVTKWQPRHPQTDPFQSFREVVDRLFDNACWRDTRPWTPNRTGVRPSDFMPHVDIRENDSAYVVIVEVPGLEPNDLDVRISRDSVTIRGERRQEQTEHGESYHYRESTSGSFQRVIPLPGPITAEKARARLKDGVLTLTLPKADPATEPGFQIEVE